MRSADAAGNLSPYATVATASTLNVSSGFTAGYAFSEGSGATTRDASTNGLTGALQGAAWTSSGKYGNALVFNGTTSYVDLGNPATLQLTSSATWSAWVYPTANPGDDGQIIAKSATSDGWQLKTTPDTGVRTFGVTVSNGASSVQRHSRTVLSLNTWYHVAGVYNTTAGTLDIYVNGVLDNGTLAGTIPATQHNSTANVNIGRRSGGYYFIGTIDEVRVYNRALSQAEIQADMMAPVGVTDTQTPTTPTNLNATPISPNQIDLNWTTSTDNVGVTGYLVESCQNAGCTSFTQIGITSTATYSSIGLIAGASYSYRIRATDAAGNFSAYSSVATTVTPATDTQPPTTPTNLTATPVSSTQITLTWTASTDNVGLHGYSIERCLTSSCTFIEISPYTTSTLYNDTGLAAVRATATV